MIIHFPSAGLDVVHPFSKQPARNIGQGEYARTCIIGNNVRRWSHLDHSAGGSRPGISKYLPVQVAGTEFVVQHLGVIVTMDEDAIA